MDQPQHQTTSGSSEPHAASYKTEAAQRANEGPTREDETQKREPTPASEKQGQKQDQLASIRDSHDNLGDLSEENLAEYTSLLVAYMRAAETKRDDAVIHDPYAEQLAGDAGAAFLQLVSKWSPHMNTMSDFIALRTRSIDEALIHRHGSIQQVVILGAGLDSRAYRMKTLADCLVIEIDTSESMMTRKEKVLKDTGAHVLAKQHHVIIADLEQDMWQTQLIEKGFNPKAPTFWLLEGLLYYMSYDSNVRLVKMIDAISAPQSQLWADISGYALVKGGDSEFEGLFRTSALKYGEKDPQKGVLSLLQWPLQILTTLDQPRELYGREWKPFTVSSDKGEEEVVPWFFVEATKPEEHGNPAPLL